MENKTQGIDVAFKIRHVPEFCKGYLLQDKSDSSLKLISEVDVQGIAPGQYAVIYTPDKRICLGSALITMNL